MPKKKPAAKNRKKTESKQKLGTFAGYTAYWGYSEDYDDEGLMVGHDFYRSGDLFRFLYRFGSLGAFRLIYESDQWESIPALVELGSVYERWGID